MRFWLVSAIGGFEQSPFSEAVGTHLGFEVVVAPEHRGDEAAATRRVLGLQLSEQFAVLEADALRLEAS